MVPTGARAVTEYYAKHLNRRCTLIAYGTARFPRAICTGIRQKVSDFSTRNKLNPFLDKKLLNGCQEPKVRTGSRLIFCGVQLRQPGAASVHSINGCINYGANGAIQDTIYIILEGPKYARTSTLGLGPKGSIIHCMHSNHPSGCNVKHLQHILVTFYTS